MAWASEGGLDFENFTKKGCFLSCEWEKSNFTTLAPPGKILEKSPGGPPWKNHSDARGLWETGLVQAAYKNSTAVAFHSV